LFFDRVVVFVENLLSSQMGVVSAIRRSSRSADRRRKTQEPYGLYVELSIRLQACLVLCCCWLLVVSRSPSVGMWTKQVLARVGRHITSHGEGRGDHQVAAFSRATLIDLTGPGRTSTPRLSRRITTKRIHRRSLTRVIMMCTIVTAKKIIIGPFCVVYCGRERRCVCCVHTDARGLNSTCLPSLPCP
jgi:hypothetical protein